ncbi:xanthine dehydrogenase family protein molybdopterin-binding subunit [Sporosalibacterium faouarense]|uniref:xanthine dehydrogenase family protein molybdopterin-binding subunit n=1 Tax=Sporosalibacterium faouarense TaxID=516123 RepID=UPI00192CDF6F|nr:molybdopterin cofactor-binding domain-containing protein [Sporosalibacterium faouarense]
MKKRGKGVGIIFYGTGYGNGFPDISKAEAELQDDGKVAIYVGATEVGQGAKTVMTQIAAEALGLKVEDIIFINEDTMVTPDSGTAAASRQSYNTGNAIKKAAEALKALIVDKAVDKMKLNTNIGLKVENGNVFVKTFPSRKISFKEIAEDYKENPLKVEEEFIAQTTEMDEETGQGAPYWPYTFSACGVEIEVDTETGIVEVIDGVLAQDVGKALNPKLVEGQMEGGFAMGMGYGIFENLNLKKGKMKNNSFTNYIIPTALDMPDIKNVIVEDPESTAPYGAKGIGEPVMIPVAPAILNAIHDAIGVRITETPVTPDKILKALK